MDWYQEEGRKLPWRKNINPYKILITEKLLQKTSYGHVLKVYDVFFDKFPNIQILANGDISDIENKIKSLGLHKQRAKHLKELSNIIIYEYDSNIPRNRDYLLKLPGIGEYIADAVLCYAYCEKIVPVDTNIVKISKRMFKWEEKPTYNKIQNKMMLLYRNCDIKDFNWALLDFAALICSKKPKCHKCFASLFCKYYACES